MPSPYHRQIPRSKSPKMKPGHRPDATPERTANWPGLPGKTQGKSRDRAKTPHVKQSAKLEGL